MHAKNVARLRRARKTRSRISRLGAVRLCINRTPRHIYAQVLSADGSTTIVAASTLDKALRSELGYGGNAQAAAVIGRAIAERAKEKGITQVAFNRSGYKYHGRVKALADAAREAGLEF